jgi:hypothetical protein
MLVKRKKQTVRVSAANQANGARSNGPATPQGRARMRHAHLKHGFYSQEQDIILRALGEKPSDFQAVCRAVWEKWAPADAFEEHLAMRLARAWWRLERADRMQEGCALRLARAAARTREERLNARAIELRMTADTLRALAEAVRQPRYVTAAGHLKLMQYLIESGEMPEIGDIAFRLLRGLEDPQNPIDLDGQAEELQNRLAMFRAALGNVTKAGSQVVQESAPEDPSDSEDSSDPSAHITEDEWKAREPKRQLLHILLNHAAEIRMIQSATALEELAEGPMDCERAAEIAPTQSQDLFLRRMEDSNFRQVARLTNMLLKIKSRAGHIPSLPSEQPPRGLREGPETEEGPEIGGPKDAGSTHDLYENKEPINLT